MSILAAKAGDLFQSLSEKTASIKDVTVQRGTKNNSRAAMQTQRQQRERKPGGVAKEKIKSIASQ